MSAPNPASGHAITHTAQPQGDKQKQLARFDRADKHQALKANRLWRDTYR